MNQFFSYSQSHLRALEIEVTRIAMCSQNSCRSYGLLRLKDEGHHLRLVDEIDERVNRNSGWKNLIWVHFSNQDPVLFFLFVFFFFFFFFFLWWWWWWWWWSSSAQILCIIFTDLLEHVSVQRFKGQVRDPLCSGQCTEPCGTEPNPFGTSKCVLGKPSAILELSFLTISLDL